MSNQQTAQPKYDEKRFFVSEDHPHYKELTTITKEFPFTMIRTGFDYYSIPFYFNETGIVIGEGDGQVLIAPDDYSKWYDGPKKGDFFNEKAFMCDNIVPHLNALVKQAAENRMDHTADEAFEAYKRLAAIEKKFLFYDYESEDTTYEKSGNLFTISKS